MMLLAGFIMLHAVDSGAIWLNGSSVVAMWAPHIADHVHAGTHCVIRTDDSRFIAVTEECKRVRELIENGEP